MLVSNVTFFIMFSTICGKFRPKMVAHLAHVCHVKNTFFMVMILSILQAVFTCHKALRYFPFAKRCLVMHLSIKRANNLTLANARLIFWSRYHRNSLNCSIFSSSCFTEKELFGHCCSYFTERYYYLIHDYREKSKYI